MVVLKVIVDEIPKSCGDCSLMEYVKDKPVCFGLRGCDYKAELTGNPYDMDYRRSDCPLRSIDDEKHNDKH